MSKPLYFLYKKLITLLIHVFVEVNVVLLNVHFVCTLLQIDITFSIIKFNNYLIVQTMTL